jgi:hypothetical protein
MARSKPFCRIGNGGVRADDGRCQGAAQDYRWISFSPKGGDTIAEDGPDCGPQSPGGFIATSALNFLEHLQDVIRFDFTQWLFAERRMCKPEEPFLFR